MIRVTFDVGLVFEVFH